MFSPESAGLLFGYRISLEEMYGFSDILPQGSILICDELAALSDNYGAGAVRSRDIECRYDQLPEARRPAPGRFRRRMVYRRSVEGRSRGHDYAQEGLAQKANHR